MVTLIGTVKVPASIVVTAGEDGTEIGRGEFEIELEVSGGLMDNDGAVVTVDRPNVLAKTRAAVAEALRHAADDIEAHLGHEWQPHQHRPVQHRDGKPPWCNHCGLTATHAKPVSHFPAPPTRGPSGGAGDSGAADE